MHTLRAMDLVIEQDHGRVTSTEYIPLARLLSAGYSRDHLSKAVRDGHLIRVRNGRFVTPDVDDELLRVARLGVRVDCVSLLHRLGVFVLRNDVLHVQATAGSSRLPRRSKGVVCHWRRTAVSRESLVADIVEALAQACRGQEPRASIATLDSALHLRLVDGAALDEVFALLPRRFTALRPMLDSRSESGPESFVRLMLRTIGASFAVQQVIIGVGRVDFLVDGWLIIECDSEAHHSGWVAGRRDRRRDLAAAALGYTTVRPIAEDIFHNADAVREQLRRTLAHGGANRRPGSRTRAR
jgi:very-short-patch-repair endonuclease